MISATLGCHDDCMKGLPFALISRVLQLSGAIVALLMIMGGSPLRAFDLPAEPGTVIQRVAFGSCNNSTQPAPIWDAVVKSDPDVWLWLGDTVYADDPRPAGNTLAERTRVVLDRLPDLYARQRALPAYQRLMSRARIMGTWDDHDYGLNDMGADFPGRAEAQQHFFDFYGEPKDSPRRTRPGVYSSITLGPPGKRLQIVMLDTRSFRSPLENGQYPRDQWVEGRPGPYRPSLDPSTTLLGAEQWAWLERTLQQPAEVRLIVSSIQVLPDDHRFEKWGNFPHERLRLLRLIHDQRIGGVIFLSGDRHTADISMYPPETDGGPFYPIHDITSSGLTQTGFSREKNRFRVGGENPFGKQNFGWIAIDWDEEDPSIKLEIRDVEGKVVRSQMIPAGDLEPARVP